jgi:hypothetical protein
MGSILSEAWQPGELFFSREYHRLDGPPRGAGPDLREYRMECPIDRGLEFAAALPSSVARWLASCWD